MRAFGLGADEGFKLAKYISKRVDFLLKAHHNSWGIFDTVNEINGQPRDLDGEADESRGSRGDGEWIHDVRNAP